jgi:hypothetical protein
MTSSMDIEVAIATGAVAFGANKVMYGGETGDSLSDAMVMTGSNLAAQVVSVGDLLPLPSGLNHVSDALGTGVAYAVANTMYPKSPFNSFFSRMLYGMVCDFTGEHIVVPAIKRSSSG